MEIKVLICPRCGADLSPAGKGNTYACSQCGLNVVLDFSSIEGQSESERAAVLERDRVRAQRDKARFERDRERAERDKVRAPIESEMQERQLQFESEMQERRFQREREKERSENKTGSLPSSSWSLSCSFLCLWRVLPALGHSLQGTLLSLRHRKTLREFRTLMLSCA